jgi:hypothetical protein
MAEPQRPTAIPVRIRRTVRLGGRSAKVEVVGTVDAWERLPAGSWFAHDTSGRLHVRQRRSGLQTRPTVLSGCFVCDPSYVDDSHRF